LPPPAPQNETLIISFILAGASSSLREVKVRARRSLRYRQTMIPAVLQYCRVCY
jgi:hypothetical protein